jgi:hypothetical protein
MRNALGIAARKTGVAAILRHGMLSAIVVAAGLASAGLFLFTLSRLIELLQG